MTQAALAVETGNPLMASEVVNRNAQTATGNRYLRYL